MALKDDLAAEVKAGFDAKWEYQTTTGVPQPTDLRLNSNHAKDLEAAAVLYADLDGSTDMVDNRQWWFSADIYKAYLRCAVALIRSEEGQITAYDGDRVMAVFVGDAKCTQAVRAALKINYAVLEIIQPAVRAYRFGNTDYVLKHKVGVDMSQLRAARIGVKGDNDLVWIGRAANRAAKLTNIADPAPLWITKDVYDLLHESVKFHLGTDMWSKRLWTQMNNAEIHCSPTCTRFLHSCREKVLAE